MNGNINFVIGGIRSGKSEYAETLAKSSGTPILYLATGKSTDSEMENRIAKHQNNRPKDWVTLEEPLYLKKALAELNSPLDILMIDCMDFWITNRLTENPESNYTDHEEWIEDQTKDLLAYCESKFSQTIIVSSEVGASLVFEYQIGRWFQDLLGLTNQFITKHSATVDYIIAGNTLRIKP